MSSLSLSAIGFAIFIAGAFASWPLIGKYTGTAGLWVNAIVLVASSVSGIALAAPHMAKIPGPSLGAMALVALAGLANGAAVYYYSVMAVNPAIPTGRFIMTVIIMMVLWSAVFAYLFFGETLNVRQWMGVAAALLAIVLLAG